MAFCVTYERANTQRHIRGRVSTKERGGSRRGDEDGRQRPVVSLRAFLRICMRRGALIHARGECGEDWRRVRKHAAGGRIPSIRMARVTYVLLRVAKGNVLEVGARGREHVLGEEMEEEVERGW